MMLARRSQSHPRTHLSRSISGSAHRSRWRTNLSLLTVGLLLLASVVFLQLKLASIRHASRRPRFEKEDDGDAELQLQQWDKIALGDDDDGDGDGDESMATSKGGSELDRSVDANSSVKARAGQGWASGSSDDPSEKLEMEGREFLEEGKVDVDSAEKLMKENMDYFEDDEINFGDGGIQDFEDLQDDQDDAFAEEEEEDKVKEQEEGQLDHLKAKVKVRLTSDEKDGKQREKDERSIPDAAKNGRTEVMPTESEILENKSEESNQDMEEKRSHPVKKLERLGQIKSVPRRIPSDGSTDHLDDGERKKDLEMDTAPTGGNVSKDHATKQSFWGNLLGLKHLPSMKDNSLSSILIARKYGFSRQPNGEAKDAKEAVVVQLPAEPRSYKPRMTEATKNASERSDTHQGIFSSDDEPLDAGIQAKLEEFGDIEDALFLNKETAPRKLTLTRPSTMASRDSSKRDKAATDLLNPLNNPLLQDPDMIGPGGLSRMDRTILKALRNPSLKDISSPNLQGIQDNGSIHKTLQYSDSYSGNHTRKLGDLSTIINSTADNHVVKASPGRSSVKMLSNNTSLKQTNLNLKKGLLPRQGDFPSDNPEVRQKIQKVLRGFTDHLQATNDPEKEELETGSARKLHDSSNSKDISLPPQQPNDHSIDVLRAVDDAFVHETNKKRVKSPLGNIFQQEFTNSGIGTSSQGNEKQETYLRSSNKQNPMEIRVEKQNDENMAERDVVSEEASTEQSSRQWGSFPGIDTNLRFSKFMDIFLDSKSCQMKVFMAWTTPPWSFSVRHQRGLESIFHFHPKACVVVFSESIELDFFKGLLEEGFRIAVVFPNLEELLEGTPTEVFSSIWFSWRKVDFFYIHYTELLRLAALYKYGGVYMDFDVILLRDISLFKNTVGQEDFEETLRLNGAIMAFERTSPFLEACLVEFTATYDDKLLSWNGADLLTRTSNSHAGEDGKKWTEMPQELNIVQPTAFFPIMSRSIHSYFRVPAREAERQSHMHLYNKILQESSAFHLWNSATATLVPETGSLVERILNHFCIKCTDII